MFYREMQGYEDIGKGTQGVPFMFCPMMSGMYNPLMYGSQILHQQYQPMQGTNRYLERAPFYHYDYDYDYSHNYGYNTYFNYYNPYLQNYFPKYNYNPYSPWWLGGEY